MTVKIDIAGEGLNYNGETNLPKAAQIIAFINSQSAVSSNATPMVVSPTLQTGVSPREALKESGATTIPQKIAVLGKYIASKNETSGFSTKELQEAFRRAGEALPANLGRDVGVAVTQGLIAEGETTGEYYITNTADDLIAARFDGAPKGGRVRATSKSGTRAKARTTLSDGVDRLEPASEHEGLPNYWGAGLKDNKSARIVWLLAFSQASGIEELSASDIEYLSTRLGDQIGSNTVPSKSKGLIKKSQIAKTPSGKFRILKGGKEFLTSVVQ